MSKRKVTNYHREPEWLRIWEMVDDQGQLCVSSELLRDDERVKRVVIPSIVRAIQRGDLQFPYKKDWMPLEEIQDNMKRFHELTLVTDNKPYRICNFQCRSGLIDARYCVDGSYLTIRTTPEWYPIYHVIADWFSEPVRLQARPSYFPTSPIKYWTTPRASTMMVQKCWDKYQRFTPYTLRESMYRILKECETFKTALAYLMYTKVFEAKSVLDFCAGWGDRLVAAMAAGIVYTGVDPNPKMLPCYQAMIKNLVTDEKERSKYTIVSDDFIVAKLPSEPAQYDLVFTCPPYYTLELYDEDSKSKQSVVQFPTVEKWIKEFLCAAITKAWKVLKKGGHMCIVLNDFNDVHKEKLKIATYCEAMVLYAQAYLPDCIYRGVIAYATSGTINFDPHQPMWTFEKRESLIGHITPNQARAALQKYYPYLVE